MGTASGTVHSWSCSALLNHLLSAETVLSVGWTGTGKGQDLLLTELPPTLSGQFLQAVVSPSVFLGRLLFFIVILKTLHWSSGGRKEQWRREWDWKEK